MRGVRAEPVVAFADGRGELKKLLPGPVEGEVYLVRVSPGESRGHHLHRAQRLSERDQEARGADHRYP